MASIISEILNTELLLLSIINNNTSLHALLKKGYRYSQIYEMILLLQKKGLVEINENDEYALSVAGKAKLETTNKTFFIEPADQYLSTEINELYIPSRYTIKDLNDKEH